MSGSEPNIQVAPSVGADPAPTPLAMPELGAVLSGHRIVEKLTAGGFGTVYVADNLGLPGQRTVVKVMPLGQLSEREADVLVHIDHPTVVKVLAVGRTDTFQYIVMEFLQGETLDALLTRYHQLGPIQAVRIAVRIADALEAVHEKGLVHRDLKPANIMLKLAKDHGKFVDWLKLIDFGLARDRGLQLTIAEGTPEYVAPETLQQQPVTPSSDLYALGVILHEMLTGQRPYQASSVNVMVNQHVSAAVPRVRDTTPDVSVELDQLVYELMSKTPEHRPASAGDVAKRLAKIERVMSEGATGVAVFPGVPAELAAPLLANSGAPSRATAEPTPLLLPLKLRPRRWPYAVGALVVVLLLLLGFGLAGGFSPRARPVAPVPPVVPAAVTPVVPVVAPTPPPAPVAEVETSGPEAVEDEIAPLAPGSRKPKAAKPVVVSKARIEVKVEPCEPTEQWKRNMNTALSDLGRYAGGHGKDDLYMQYEPDLGRAIKNATSTSECASARAQFQKLRFQITGTNE